MKKVLTVIALSMAVMSASAEKLYQNSRFFDNWSIGIEGGAVAPTRGHAVISDTRGVFGANLTKQISPVFGLQFEGQAYINTFCSATPAEFRTSNTIDATNVSLNGLINLMNLFGGYKGKPRLFEIEALVGAGWAHRFAPEFEGGDYYDAMTGKFGLNLNFNCGTKRAWTVGVKPAIVYNLTGASQRLFEAYNVKYSNIELLAGVTYHFKNSNGTHSFAFGRGYDQAEVDALNACINDLRGTVADKDAALASAQRAITDLQQALDECNRKAPVIKTVTETKTVTTTNNIPDVLVTFRQGKSVVDASQLPNVERVATYLVNHKNSKVVIRGYASPEGSAEINAKIATARANAVKDILVKKYRIAADRITAEGQGVGDMFSESDWNRVSICTISE